MKKTVSVLVITLNELPELKKLVASLREQDYRDYELVICDNNSADGTVGYARRIGAKYVNTGRNAGTAAFNLGLGKASGKYLLFIATDMLITRGCIRRLVEELESDSKCAQAVFVNAKLEAPRQTDFSGSWLSRGFYAGTTRGPLPKRPVRIPYYGPGLIRRSVIEEIGGVIYDPGFFLYGEDVDLGLRIALRGYTVKLVPDAAVLHGGSQAKKLWSRGYRTFLVERNMITAMLKNLELGSLAVSLPYAILLRLAVLVKDLLSLDFERAAARIRAAAWVAANLPDILARRRLVQEFRRVPDSSFSGIFSEKYVAGIFLKKIIGREPAA